MPTTKDADRLARLVREARPLAKKFARAGYNVRADLHDRCGVDLPFLTLYLNANGMDDHPAFEGTGEDDHDKILDVVHHGTVREWSPSKGYGYISADDGSDVLAHVMALRATGCQTLPVGARVTFNKLVRDDGRAQVFRFIAVDPR